MPVLQLIAHQIFFQLFFSFYPSQKRNRAKTTEQCTADTKAAILRYLYWQMNYHIEHHLYPSIPHYHLPEAHQKLKLEGVLNDAQVFSLLKSLKIIFGLPNTPPLATEGS